MANRFASPLLEFGYPPAVEELKEGKNMEKPLLLYIPGFDGTYLSAFFQYPELHSLFEIKCLVSTMDDRSTFEQLKQTILDFLAEETTSSTTETTHQTPNNIFSGLLNRNGNHGNGHTTSVTSAEKKKTTRSTSATDNQKQRNRPVYLAGESFGGILALEVALSLLGDATGASSSGTNHNINLQGLVLVNAATCYDRSRLAAEGPPVADLPPILYIFGILKLLPMFLDKISLPQFIAIIQGNALPSLIDNPMREAYMGRLAFALPFLLKFMPQETFQWRLEQWLSVGCKRMETKLTAMMMTTQAQSSTPTNNHNKSSANNKSAIQKKNGEPLRTLIVAGENDLTLPSIAEAERLAQILSPNSHLHVVKEAGHANTCGTCLDLAAEMRSHFPELQQATGKRDGGGVGDGRTQMKQVARDGQGIFFGMEPRYDGKAIGLSPLSYWSQEYYRKVEGHSPR